ncbi:hypothetical protein HDV02_006623, partial [Globomyces sp. JEL0801]
MSSISPEDLAGILLKNEFVVLTGAGISISSGMKPFRVNGKSQYKSSLTATQFFTNGDSMQIFNHAATMIEEMQTAKPSKFHLFLRYFLKTGNLVRHYTMNVDCLENYVRTRTDRGKYVSLDEVTVRLHGDLLKAR